MHLTETKVENFNIIAIPKLRLNSRLSYASDN